MTNDRAEGKLRTALEHAAPNDLDGVLSQCPPQQQGAEPPAPLQLTPARKKKKWLPMAVAACLALVLVGGGAGGYYIQANTVASVVSLDVNPSVTLTVNRKETVLSAVPVNEDGADILDGMDLTGAKVDVAVNAIVGSLLKNGYVDQLANSILITVEDEDADRGAQLQQALTQQADALLASAQINGAILSQTIQNSEELRQKAEEYGISAGKAALIQAIVDGSNELHTFEELAGLTINDLNLLYSSLNAKETSTSESAGAEVDGSASGTQTTTAIQSSGQASDGGYIGMETAKSAAFAHAGVSSSQVTALEVDFDYEQGRMVYEIEFYAEGVEYDYDIDALTGEVVKFS